MGEIQAVQSPKVERNGESPIDAVRTTLLNLEGRAGALYWECVQRLLPAGRFTTRNHQGAVDDVNALLNYGYGILYSQVWSALSLAGLEPFAGFLHVDRPGKPSLVLDFIEEFRQPIVDRVVFAMINKKFKVEWEEPDDDAAKSAHQSAKRGSGRRADAALSEQRYAARLCRPRAGTPSGDRAVRAQRPETLQHHPDPSASSGDVPAPRTGLSTVGGELVRGGNCATKPSFFRKTRFLDRRQMRKIQFRSGYYYHIYNRGVNRQAIFFNDENWGYFMRRLRHYCTSELIEIIAYCLMPNHYHLLVYLKDNNLSTKVMQPLAVSYTKSVNRQQGRVGPIFQGAFQAKLVDKTEYLLYLSRYLHLNPVLAGLVENPATWTFSSYRDYVGLRKGTLPRPDVVLSHFPSRESYAEFVKGYSVDIL